MPRDEKLIGTRISRVESPEIELLMQESIGDALAQLITVKGLYQKTEISFINAEKYLVSIGFKNIELIKKEFSKRPWVPISPDLSPDDLFKAENFSGIGPSPLSASSDELKLTFPLPVIKSYCGFCKEDQTYTSIGIIFCDSFLDFYPRVSDKTEQIFYLTYNCTHCKQNPIVFLIKRDGCKITLCGRSERLRVNVSPQIPKELRGIVQDAISAANENDVHAGFYHLRTFCEHYMKNCLIIDKEIRTRGEDLCALYNKSLDDRMKAGLPSMSVIYDNASKYMHERSGDHQLFEKTLQELIGHLEAKALFLKFANK